MPIQRKILRELKKEINKKKISILVGPRQVGKTTLMKMVYEEISEKNKCLFLDIDIVSNYEKASSFENLLNEMKINGYDEKDKNYFYLFLDEFQKYPEIVRVMKNIYDNLDNVKIFASGSSSLTIKNQIQESLAGRKIIHNIYPLDFEEFLVFKKENGLAKNIENIKKLKGKNLSKTLKKYNSYLEEFLIFGGYPEVVLSKNKKDKVQTLESIFDLYVKKDLVEYLNVKKILDVKKIIEFLAVNNGRKIKYEEISGRTSLKFNEIKNYLEILSETYLIEIIRPFFTNKNKEITKIPKIYFIDNGVKNYFIKNFNKLEIREDSGMSFEGFVLSELLKKGKKGIKTWQDKNKNEVDFILEEENLIPIEIKFKENLKKKDLKGLNVFLERYKKSKKGFLLNMSKQQKENNIEFILPFSVEKIK